jgi:hypothetical protein
MSAWLAAAYAVLALGIAWALIGAGSWKRRVPFILCAPPLAVGLWLGRPDPAGWPSLANVPKHAGLVWAQVDEPDPATANPGRIYLWLDTGKPAPRAYSMPYSRPLHERVQQALKAIRRGDPIAMARLARRRTPSARQQHTREPTSTRVRFYRQPPVQLPPKTPANNP